MSLRFIRPEDRRRSSANGAGSGFGAEWADTEPACMRSEAFAEDLHPEESGRTHAPPTPRRLAPSRLLGRGTGWVPVLGLALAAAMGLRAAD